MKIDIGNLVLTKGESSDLYEITSNVSLKDYKAKIRISSPEITPIEKELKHLPEVKMMIAFITMRALSLIQQKHIIMMVKSMTLLTQKL